MNTKWIITPFNFIMIAIIVIFVAMNIISIDAGLACLIINFWGYIISMEIIDAVYKLKLALSNMKN